MTPADRPRFRIADGLVLIAAVAVGLGLIRFTGEENLWTRGSTSPGKVWHCLMALPLSWSVAGLAMTRRGAGRRRALRAPGVLACVAVSIASAMAFAAQSHSLILWDSRRFPARWPWQAAILATVEPDLMAIAVAATWAVLLVNRRWRPRRDWLDRAGIILGLVWLGSALVAPALRLFAP
jgi:hypothetical protein